MLNVELNVFSLHTVVQMSDRSCFPVSLNVANRFSLHKIEQELNTEIRPIPKSIDKDLYVAELQQAADGIDNSQHSK